MNTEKLSFFQALLSSLNIMVGIGIIVAPAIMAKSAGNASFLVWPLVMICFLPIVLGIARISQLFPQATSFFHYTRYSLTRFWGYVVGFLSYLGYTYTGVAIVVFFRATLLLKYPGFWLVESTPWFFGLISAFLFILNVMPLHWFQALLSPAIFFKFIPLVIAILALPFALFIKGFPILTANNISGLPSALTLGIFGYFGFEYCANIGAYLKNPEKEIPKVMMSALAVTTILYSAFHYSLLVIMGSANLVSFGASSYANFLPFSHPVLIQGISFLIVMSVLCSYLISAAGVTFGNIAIFQSLNEGGFFRDYSKFLLQNQRGSTVVKHTVQFMNKFIRVSNILPALVQCFSIVSLGVALRGNSGEVAGLANISILAGLFITLVGLLRQEFLLKSPFSKKFLAFVGVFVSAALLGYSCLSCTTLGAKIIFYNIFIMLLWYRFEN